MTTALDPNDPAYGDRLARRNAFVLAASMALAGANASVIVATGSLMGKMLAPDPSLATLPVSAFVFGTALGTYPASFFMKAVGRRSGFMTGGLLGVLSGLVSALSVWLGSFWLFTLGATLGGAYQSFIVLYRYAAADTASPGFRPKAISWVMAGGVVASIIGPQLVIATQDMMKPLTFFATYFGQAGFAALAIWVTSRFTDGPPIDHSATGLPRPMGQILRNRVFLAAVLCGMVSQAMMNMVMTATPIAMIGCGFTVTESTLGIQWHVLAMYLPSFYTGNLIARFGKGRVVLVGLVILTGAGVMNLAGVSLYNFWIALILLGVGWNLAFVGATAIVTDCHTPAERAKVQGFTDFSIFGLTTIASFMAGYLYSRFGWSAVNGALIPVTVLAMVAVVAAGLLRNRPAQAG